MFPMQGIYCTKNDLKFLTCSLKEVVRVLVDFSAEIDARNWDPQPVDIFMGAPAKFTNST